MAKKAKKQKTSTGGKSKKKGLFIFGMAFSLCAILFAKYAFIFLLLALIPTAVAYLVDKHPGKLAFQIVMACNLCGVLPYLGNLIVHRSESDVFWSTISNIMMWIMVYGAAAVGWVILSFTPSIAFFILNQMNRNKVNQLRSAQKKLVEEWGPDIRIPEEAPKA